MDIKAGRQEILTYKGDLTDIIVKWKDIKDEWPITVPYIPHDAPDDLLLVKAITQDEWKVDGQSYHQEVYLPITKENVEAEDHLFVFHDDKANQSRYQYLGDLNKILKDANITIEGVM